MRLRALEPEDLELLYTIENDRSLWWLGTQTAPLSMYHLRDYIAQQQCDIYKDEQVRFVIDVDGTAAGLIDLFNFSPQHRRAELGVVLRSDVQGRGIAREAIGQILDYARDVVSLHQIYAVVPSSNDRSVRMLEAAGFHETAVLQDWINHSGKYENASFMTLLLGENQ